MVIHDGLRREERKKQVCLDGYLAVKEEGGGFFWSGDLIRLMYINAQEIQDEIAVNQPGRAGGSRRSCRRTWQIHNKQKPGTGESL